MKSKIKTMLHPIRMRIIQTLLDGKEMTAGEMAEKLQDIPQASLYRCPALAINGSTDVQVTPEKALGLGQYVKGPAEAYVIEGMNHLLKENSEQASLLNIIKEYRADMDKPLHPELQQRLLEWVERHYKSLACSVDTSKYSP